MELIRIFQTVGAGLGGVALFVLLAYWIGTKVFAGYWLEKGKNLATKQDIEAITREVEAVRLQHATLLESTKARNSFLALQRERSELIAELFAEWLSHPEDRKKLNELAIRANLWLPSEEALLVNRLLAWKGGSVRHTVIAIRKVILQDGDDGKLAAQDITLFSRNNEAEQPTK